MTQPDNETLMRNLRDRLNHLDPGERIALLAWLSGYVPEAVEKGLGRLPTWLVPCTSTPETDRSLRTDLCEPCKDENHVTCSLVSWCSCCQTTIAQMQEEAG